MSGKEVKVLYRPTYCKGDETNRTTEHSGRVGSKKKPSQETGLTAMMFFCRRKIKRFVVRWIKLSSPVKGKAVFYYF